jgi:hypothetical protein
MPPSLNPVTSPGFNRSFGGFESVPDFLNFTPDQLSLTVRAGGKVFGGLPILPDETAEYKTTYSRRRLTENGLSSVDLESRFYAVLSKAAQVA